MEIVELPSRVFTNCDWPTILEAFVNASDRSLSNSLYEFSLVKMSESITRYAPHATSLMTVGLESGDPLAEENLSEETGNADKSPTNEPPQENDVIVIDDTSEDDDVVFVSSYKASKKEVFPLREPGNEKPCRMVKPFTTTKDVDEEIVFVDNDDDVDDEEDAYYRELFDKFEKEYAEEESSDNFDIHDLCETAPTPRTARKKIEIRLQPVSETTIYNYSSRGKWKSESSSDDSADPTYVPADKRRREDFRKRKADRSPHVPAEPSAPTRDWSVYFTRTLDKSEKNWSKITFCDRVVDFVGCQKPPKVAAELCRVFWDGLSIRTKRKYLPRSKFALCTNGLEDPHIQEFIA